MGTIRDQGVYTIVETADGQGDSQWGKLKSGAGWIALDYVTPNNPGQSASPLSAQTFSQLFAPSGLLLCPVCLLFW
ncbi:MAG: hypothetical protein ACLSCQ_03305 [Evtepia gabavorous]